jgi:hypothetical protein
VQVCGVLRVSVSQRSHKLFLWMISLSARGSGRADRSEMQKVKFAKLDISNLKTCKIDKKQTLENAHHNCFNEIDREIVSEATIVSVEAGHVTVDGPLVLEDSDQFKEKTSGLSKATVVLRSNGGEAIRLEGLPVLSWGVALPRALLRGLAERCVSRRLGPRLAFMRHTTVNLAKKRTLGTLSSALP